MNLAHLVRRFAGSLSRRPPGADDLAWVRTWLGDGEWDAWCQFGPVDQRHTIEVARRAVTVLAADPPPRSFVAGALLHDIGKLDAGLGTMGRVLATTWGAIGRSRATGGAGRFGRYLRHEPIGAERCRRIGSDATTVALVGRTGEAPSAWTAALSEADDSL